MIIPLFKMFRLGKIISHNQAAIIIGQHFPNVEDKLLNTLQLQSNNQGSSPDSLLEASIKQKIESLRPIPFSSAIDLRENKKFLKFALVPVGVVLVLLFAAPSILTKPTERLIKHGQIIAEEAPFKIRVTNPNLQTPENSDFQVDIELSGSEIPDKIYLLLGGQQYLLEKENAVLFHYTFRNVTENIDFAFSAGGFFSDQYELNVIPSPVLIDFSVNLVFPAYIKRENEFIKNTGDLVVPQGTKLSWVFGTRNTSELEITYNDSTYHLNGDDEFRFSQIASASIPYSIRTSNEFMRGKDSIAYRIQVVPDLFPQISLQEERDSNSLKLLYFSGRVQDDYGFKKLLFNYQFTSSESNSTTEVHSIDIPVSHEIIEEEFFYGWDLAKLNVLPGDKISYYFEVWDNDGYNGSKSTRSVTKEFAMPTEAELNELIDQKNENIKDQLEESLKGAKKLEKELEELQRQLLEKKEMSWQDKKKLEDLLKKQQELQKQIEEIQQENKQKNQQENEINKQDEDLLQKQKQLEELMNQVMTPELQKMMEEMQRMMEELNKDEIQKELDKMDLSNEDMEKELDRALEQFKQLEWEQKMEKNIEKLKELSKKQEDLAEKAEQKDAKSEEIKKEQDELNKEFEDLKKEMDEAEKLNEELENPNKSPETEKQEEEIQQEQKKSSDELQKNKKSSASKSQKSASQKMQKMAESMEMAMKGGEQEQQQEDMEALRALLENIITLSFDQEALMGQFKSIDMKDPNFIKLGQTQRKLKDDAKMVEDSLFALSKRVPQLSSMVNHEINLVNENMNKALENIPDRKTPEITTSQQYVMTSFNNLALLLDEALKQMQNQSSCSKPGQGNCEKPGGNGSKPKPSAGQIKQMQQNLQKQLEQMKKEGKNKGESKAGSGPMSKQLAEMAAKQAAIRKMAEEKANELNQDGSGNGNEMKQIAKDMENLQKDIVNNRVDENTLKRQQDIMIRLLKAEEAERTRDKDNQRKSNESINSPTSNPLKYAEYMKRKQKETELLKTVPPSLKPHYKDRVNSYFLKIDKQ